MKCSGKHDTTVHAIFHVVSRFLRYISCYIAENRFPLGQYPTEELNRQYTKLFLFPFFGQTFLKVERNFVQI